jgi:hypothetical protein
MNIVKIITVTLIIIGLTVVAVYLMGQFQQTKPIYDKIMGVLTPAATQIKSFVATPTGAVTALGSVGSIASIAGLAYSKISAAKAQVTQVTNAAKTQIEGYKTQATEITNTIEGYKTQATDAVSKLTSAEKELSDLKASASTASTTEIQKLINEKQGVIDQNKQFLNGLMAAANGALIANPVDGKIYSVLKVPPEVQVK